MAEEDVVDVSICNQALLLLGAETISSVDEVNDRAKLCKILYLPARNAVLRMHPWNFAIKRLSLGTVNTAPISGYSFEFNMPEELLRLLSIDDFTDWKVEGRKILIDSDTIIIRYVYKNKLVSEYDSIFLEALAAYLAWKFSYPLTKSNTKTKEMLDLFTGLLKIAKNVDASEEPGDTVGNFPFIEARSRQ